jgi:hypothetical protein
VGSTTTLQLTWMSMGSSTLASGELRLPRNEEYLWGIDKYLDCLVC